MCLAHLFRVKAARIQQLVPLAIPYTRLDHVVILVVDYHTAVVGGAKDKGGGAANRVHNRLSIQE
jgi:hypothetical protein